MVILLQLCIFVAFAVFRGRTLFGAHLRPIALGSEELSFRLQYRSQRLSRHVGLALPGAIPFVVRRERPYHRLLKNIGMSCEIAVGDRRFDEHYFITTDFPGHLSQLLASRQLKQHVHELFQLPVKSLHATRRRIWCVIAREDVSEPDPYFRRHLALLRAIHEDCRAAQLRGHGAPGWGWRGVAALSVIAVQAGLLTLGLLGFLPTYLDSVHTIELGWLVVAGAAAGIAAALFWLVFILGVFHGTSWFPWVLADFVLCGLLGFALTGIAVVRDANIQLPQPQAGIHRQAILEKSCVLRCRQASGRRSRQSSYSYHGEAACAPLARQQAMEQKQAADAICATRAWFEYTLAVRHWRKPGAYAFATDVRVFDVVRVGDRVRLPINPGALGLEWVDWNDITAR